MQTQLVIASRLKFAQPTQIEEAETLSHEIGQMLAGLAKYLASPKST